MRHILLTITLFISHPVFADAWIQGRVIKISNGDTIHLQYIKPVTGQYKKIKIRLYSIDAPEMEQPGGQEAKHQLSEYLHGAIVKVRVVNIDAYGRYVGEIWFTRPHTYEDMNVNLAMVRSGLAWVYQKYAKNPEYLYAEEKAQIEKLGIWSLGPHQLMPPWEWRKKK